MRSNYAEHVTNLPGFDTASVIMLSYDHFQPDVTLDPDTLAAFFPTRSFVTQRYPALDGSYGVVYHIDAR